MTAVKELLQQIPDPNLSANERVRLRCELAQQFEKTGNYEAACRALDNLWPAFGEPPNLDMLDERTSGEVLLRVGVLTGWIGSIRLIKGSQKIAKDRISESIAIFEALPDVKKVAEAQMEIAYCYRREGAVDEARRWYSEALARLDDGDGDLKAVAVLRSALIDLSSNRLNDALVMLRSADALFAASFNHALRGSFHNAVGLVLKTMSTTEGCLDYIEQVLKEYAAASFHFEQAGHTRYQASIENNLAMVLSQAGRFAEAHDRLDRAQALCTRLNDRSLFASFEDSRAQVFLAEGELAKAQKIALNAVTIMEKGDEHPLLTEALTTYGVVLARLNRADESRAIFERALTVAGRAGDPENAAHAALSFVEQLAERLPEDELCNILEFAHNSLKDTQNAESKKRLTDCVYRALSLIHTARPDWSNFSLDETLLRHEARFIQMALEDSDGSITRAADLLGLPGHQSLNFILNRRHPQLLSSRRPVKPRRRSIIKNDQSARRNAIGKGN